MELIASCDAMINFLAATTYIHICYILAYIYNMYIYDIIYIQIHARAYTTLHYTTQTHIHMKNRTSLPNNHIDDTRTKRNR